jgi:site-specific DNA recombinase
MGMARAAREGKWTNRPKTGYDLIDKELVPSRDAETVLRIFELRASGCSYSRIEELTGVKYSTVHGILDSRIYLGEVVYRGEWFKGHHEPIVTPELFDRAHRGWVPGRKRLGRHPLSGVVRCGLCGRAAATEDNGKGARFYRCWHRGRGCDQPSRSVRGIERAALLGLRLVGFDDEVQAAIRRELRRSSGGDPRRGDARATAHLAGVRDKRRKLLDLHYSGKISADLFAEEEAALSAKIETLEAEQTGLALRESEPAVTAEAFEEVARTLGSLDFEEIWQEATNEERRVLANDLLDGIAFFPDHLEVKVAGAPKMNVTLQEVGLTGGSGFCGVGEGTRTPTPCAGTRPST